MGIQLDWQIESERAKQRASEDPGAKKYRRRQRRNLLLAMLVLTCLVGGVLGTVLWRLRSVDNQIRDNLLDTTEVEITALRVGNEANFMQVKRSASEDWLQTQRDLFDEYQQLKQAGKLELTGRVLDVTIDEPRGRVVLEEIVSGVPYRVVWFYWLYEDTASGQAGWRRVPPDVEFWGDEKTINKNNLRVSYRELDKRMAEALATRVGEWWEEGCILLVCSQPLPELTIEIVPETLPAPEWDLYEEWEVRVPSPLLAGRARDDVAFSPETEMALAQLLVARLVQYNQRADFRPDSSYGDAEWLHDEITKWLIGRFTENPANGSAFLETFVAAFGEEAPGQILYNLHSGFTLSNLDLVTSGVSLPNLGVEKLNALIWNDFFQWRLNLENFIPSQRGPNSLDCQALFDTSVPNAATIANSTCASNDPNKVVPTVTTLTISLDNTGNLLAYVEVLPNPNDPSQTAQVIFRWDGTTWKRIQ